MTGRISERKQPGTSAPKTRTAQYALVGAVCALVIGLYGWSAKSGWLELWGSSAEDTYYNLLVQGFRSGQLDLKREVPSGLAKLADPYDPLANRRYLSVHRPLLDLSYYKGKLYLYFGVTPVLVLFWPYAALTGHYLPHRDAVVIFFSMGFLASVSLLWALWRRYFAEVSVGVMAAAALALGLATLTLACLQRCDVYEVAISCGYAFTMVTLTLLWKALHARQNRVWWLAGASLAYGLAIGARPSLLFGAVILLVPVAMSWRERVEPGQRPQLWTLLLAATAPILLIGLGLMLYNYLRFDHPLDFGWRYQLCYDRQDTIQPFSLRFLWFNFCVYFLEPARWSAHFPFVHDITAPSLPAGHTKMDHAFGILTNIPLIWLAVATPLLWRGRPGEARSALRWFGVTLVLLFGICALVLGLFFAAAIRYQVEFLAPLVLLAAMSILGLECALLTGRPLWRRATRWGWGLLLAFSVSFNLVVMFDRSSDAYLQLGLAFFYREQAHKAIVQFEKALELQPDNADAHTCLGAALFRQGKVTQGINHLEEAIRLKPDLAVAHANLGVGLLEQGKMRQAIGHLKEALRLNPKYAEALEALEKAFLRLGDGLAAEGKWDEAIQQYQRAMQTNADSVHFHDSLGMALIQRGRQSEAVRHFWRAVELDPRLVSALNNLALILATQTNMAIRNVEEAVRCAERACKLTTNSVASHLDTLGMTYSEVGRFNEAVQATERAAALARAAGNEKLAARIESRLKHYREGQPYHAISKGTAP